MPAMRWLEPELASALLALPLAASLWLLQVRAKRRFRAETPVGPVLRRLSALTPGRHDALLLLALLVSLGGLLLAALRPQLLLDGRVPEYARQDLILILDRSASMRATDVSPSRFGRAVQEIESFLTHKPEAIDRVALVAFAGTSLTVSHPTRDPNSLFFFLDWIRDDATLHFGTDVAAALGSAREIVARDDSPNRKIFLLLSDGDDHGARLDALLDTLRRERVRVHCIGIGSERETPIPVGSRAGVTQYLEDDEGQLLLTRFDPASLRGIASLTGGRYFRSTSGRELVPAMRQIVASERRQVGWRESIDYRDAHRPLLLAAALATLVLLVKA